MDDLQIHTLPLKDVATALVRQARLHQGKWQPFVESADCTVASATPRDAERLLWVTANGCLGSRLCENAVA